MRKPCQGRLVPVKALAQGKRRGKTLIWDGGKLTGSGTLPLPNGVGMAECNAQPVWWGSPCRRLPGVPVVVAGGGTVAAGGRVGGLWRGNQMQETGELLGGICTTPTKVGDLRGREMCRQEGLDVKCFPPAIQDEAAGFPLGFLPAIAEGDFVSEAATAKEDILIVFVEHKCGGA